MPELLFRGAHIRYVDLRHKEEAGVFVRLHLTADYSTPICDHFGWPSDLDESITQCKLAGELAAVNMVLTPNDPALRCYEIQFECRDLSDFQLMATKQDGEVSGHELRFIARSGQADAESLAGAWLRTIGNGTGNLRVVYADQAKLESADNDQMPLDHNYAEVEDGDGPLPSVTMMAGSTDRLKKERRKRQRPEGKGLEPLAEVALGRPIPGALGPEWRTAEEIAAGVPLYHGEAK